MTVLGKVLFLAVFPILHITYNAKLSLLTDRQRKIKGTFDRKIFI